MAIKRGSKVDKSFSSSAMTDLMFLLLIFMLIATTLITPNNALKLDLPKSTNQMSEKKVTTVSIKHDRAMDSYIYYVEEEAVAGVKGVENALKTRLQEQQEPTVSLHCDKSVAVDEVVKIMNIAKDNGYRLILATQME
jgi:biopolymer transport protein ExbD